MRCRPLIPVVLFGLLGGCAAPTMFEWGNYDEWLYENYENPKDDEELYVDLTALITEYESRTNPATKPMAPGLYAEYGFLLMRRGENQRAVEYYTKEKALWPESAKFMDSMIETARIAAKASGNGGAR
jgi:hypothetical protein